MISYSRLEELAGIGQSPNVAAIQVQAPKAQDLPDALIPSGGTTCPPLLNFCSMGFI